MNDEMPTTPSDLAPGMSQVVYAGTALDITDREGGVFTIEAREGEETMAFLKAFDEWFTLIRDPAPHSKVIADALFEAMRQKFNDLPSHILRQLPSMKRGGFVLREHSH